MAQAKFLSKSLMDYAVDYSAAFLRAGYSTFKSWNHGRIIARQVKRLERQGKRAY